MSRNSRQVRRRLAHEASKLPLKATPTPTTVQDLKGPRLSTGIAALACLAALSGCTTTIVRETPLADRIPAGLLTCRDRPVPGALERQSDVARYVVDLDAAGADCRSKVKAVREIVEADPPTD